MIFLFICLAHSLELWKIQDGQLKEYDFKIYELNITNPELLINSTLVVLVMPTIGKPDLAVNCDTQPKLMEFFDWQGESDYFQEIAISYNERQQYNCSDSKFYIGVSSEAPSAFHLYSYIIQQRLPIIFNMPISGVLEKNDFSLFSLHPQKDYEQISLQVLHGNITMYVRQCESLVCDLTKDNLSDEDLVKDKQYINFIYNKDECQNCSYLIGITSDDQQKYRIVAKHNSSRGILREGWFDTQLVLDGEYKYYEFDVPDNQSIEQIFFLTTLDYGSIKIQTSEQNMFPNLTNFEHQDESNIELTQFKDKIYISIFGVEQSYYSIYVIVKRSLKLSDTNFIQLQSGKQQNYTQTDEFSFFKFQVENEKKQNISILLTPISGEFIFYVIGSKNESDEIPDSYTAQWEGVRALSINYDHETQYENYYITVEKLSNASGIFKIQYTVSDALQFANVGDQIIDTIYPNQYNYYRIPMVAENLTITKNIYSHSDIESLQIYISLNQDNQRPNINNYTYYFNTKSIELSGNDLFCDKTLIYHIAQHICYIYISVTSNETVFYSLQSFVENTKIKLFEGYPIHLPLGNYSFYYNLVGKEIVVYARTHGGDLNLTAWYGTEFNKTEIFKGKEDWFQSQELAIPQSNEQQINIDIVTNGTKSEYTYLLIGIYQDVQFLSESIPIKGQLDEGEIKYYSIKITQNNSILISLNLLSGVGYIVADKGLNSRPTFSKNQYISYGYYHDHIYIDNEIIDTIGDYIIGVQCFYECIYQLVYTSGKFQLFHLLQDHQFDHYFYPNQPVYFVINQLHNQTLKLLINMIEGQLLVNIKQYNNTHFEQVINDPQVLQKTTINRDTKFIFNQSNQSILLELIAQNQIAHAIVELVSLKNPILLKENLSWRDQLDADQSQLYYVFTKGLLQLQMNVYLGEIKLLIKRGVQQFHDDEAEYSYRINTNQLINITVDQNVSDIYLVKIIGIYDNNIYTIQIIKNITKIPLNFGYPVVGHAYKDNITYTFESNQNQNEFITLMIHLIDCNETCLSVEVNHTNETFPVYNIERSEKLLIYQLYTIKGVYSINVAPSQYVDFQIVANTNQTYYFLEDMLWQIQQSQSKQNTFELFVEEKTQFQLKAFTCGGTFLVQATKDIKNADKSLYEIQFQLTPQQLVQKVLQLDPGIYYFVFRGVRMPYVSTYQRIMIRGQFLDLTERSPQENYKIRLNGIINYTFVDNQISVRVPTIERMSNQDNVTKIQIIINLNNNPDNQLLCQYEVQNEPLIQSDHTIIYDQDNYQYPVYAFIRDYNHSFKYIHAIAQVYIDNQNQATYLYSSSQIIDVQTTDNEWLRVLIIMFIIFIIIIATYYIIQYVRNRKNEKKSDVSIEMNYQVFR